jgi:hypothetical protein
MVPLLLLPVSSAMGAAVNLLLSIDDVYWWTQAATMLLPPSSAKGAAVAAVICKGCRCRFSSVHR